ncbi:MAG: extracellular solute-binding protein [Rhodoluna sp.]|nr:extracellular solute-binding protein [Rhodoluna sp.]
MRRSVSAIATVSALVASVALVAPASNAAETITSGGSSYANSIISTCAAAYKTDNITYASVGSGTGRTNFRTGTYDFGATDAPYAATDVKPANFTYVPLVGGPIAVVFNVEGVKSLNLTPKVLGGIMNGRYKTWNDDEIQKLNPKAVLPSDSINVVYRSGSSGTTQAFANYLRGNGASGWKDNGTWTTASGQSTPVGSSAGNAQLLVEGVQKTKNSIGYADLSDVASKGLPYAALRNPLGAFVLPSVKTAAAFLATHKVLANGILDIEYNKPVKGGYNASLVTYALASTASANPAKGAAVKKFLTYVINSCAPSKAPGLNYSPLAAALKAKALQLVATVK